MNSFDRDRRPSGTGRATRLALLLVTGLMATGCNESTTASSHYPTGTLWSVRRYHAGEPIDPWVVWWPNARTRHQMPYEDGRREGVWRTYAETGQLVLERTYSGDELHGPWRFTQPDGTPIEEGAFERGRRVGVWRRYDAAGTLAEEVDHGPATPRPAEGAR